MSTFAFRAVDLGGSPARGELEATSKSQVTEQLRQRGLIVLDVTEKSAPVKLESFLDRFKSVPMRELAESRSTAPEELRRLMGTVRVA